MVWLWLMETFGSLVSTLSAPVFTIYAVVAPYIARPVNCLLRPFITGLDSSLIRQPGGSASVSEESAFRAAAARVGEYGAHLSTAVRLRLYALYKQATLGDAPASPSGGLLDAAAQVKWRSWAGLRGMGAAEAMTLYSSMVKQEIGESGSLPEVDIWADGEEEEITGLPAEMLDVVPHASPPNPLCPPRFPESPCHPPPRFLCIHYFSTSTCLPRNAQCGGANY